MRVVRILLASLALLATAPAWCNDIVAVLERSQTMRMQALPPAAPDSERAARVHASFERLAGVMALPGRVELRIVGGGIYAEAMLGHVIVASEALADMPEGERLFILAHELGHIALGHWDELRALYRRHIPGEVRPETTDPVADALGAEAHEQAYPGIRRRRLRLSRHLPARLWHGHGLCGDAARTRAGRHGNAPEHAPPLGAVSSGRRAAAAPKPAGRRPAPARGTDRVR